MQHIIEALARDVAEALRPMVVDMVRKELANADGEKAMEGIAASIDLEKLAQHIDLAILAGELTDSQLNDIAGDIDLEDLASELDAEKIAAELDMDEAIRDFFSNNTFSIRP